MRSRCVHRRRTSSSRTALLAFRYAADAALRSSSPRPRAGDTAAAPHPGFSLTRTPAPTSQMLAGTIGSRPIGTRANARARAYVVDQLKLFGYDVRVQETDARRPRARPHGARRRTSSASCRERGAKPSASSRTTIRAPTRRAPPTMRSAWRCRWRPRASSPRRPTAAVDDLSSSSPTRKKIGLMGAAALVERSRGHGSAAGVHQRRSDRFIRRPSMLFETGPGNHWLVRPWARRAPHPRGGSFAIEIYQRLPNDTDFSILKRHDIPGLNFAIVGDSYAYHTARDTPDRLSPQTLREHRRERRRDRRRRCSSRHHDARTVGDATYFDIGGTRRGQLRRDRVDWITHGARCRARRASRGSASPGSSSSRKAPAAGCSGCSWTAARAVATFAAMIGATWLLRARARSITPGTRDRIGLFLMLIVVGAALGVDAWPAPAAGSRRARTACAIRRSSGRRRCRSGSLSLWHRPGWRPRAAYLWTLPLLAAGLAAAARAGTQRRLPFALASVIVLAVPAHCGCATPSSSCGSWSRSSGRLPVRHAGLRLPGAHRGCRPHGRAAASSRPSHPRRALLRPATRDRPGTRGRRGTSLAA